MEELGKKLEKSAENLEQLTDRTNIAIKEMRLQFEAISEIQKDERETMLKLHNAETDRIRKHYGRIIASLIATILLMVAGAIGGMIYIFGNYDFQTYEFTQDLDIGGDGTNTINDGLHFGVGG